MATIRLFDKDSYVEEFHGTVLSCEKYGEDLWQVVLDQTAFFPEGGGQAGDTGWLDGIEVIDTQEKEGMIFHLCKAPLMTGSKVLGKLDFPVRFDKMQQHTGEHILSGIICGTHGYHNVGFHLGEDVTTLDFDGELTAEQLKDAEIRANEAIFQNHPVIVRYPSKEELKSMEYRSKIEIAGQVRIVEIPGVDRCACCAPHVKTTAEVGLLKILSCDRHRGGCRLSIVCGERSWKDYHKKQEIIRKVSAALSAKPERIPEAVEQQKEQQKNLRIQLNEIQERYFNEKLEKITSRDRFVILFEDAMDEIAARNFVNEAMERCEGICGVFLGTEETGFRYILGSTSLDVRKTASQLNARFQGKGGGKPQMVQGTLTGKEIEILNSLKELPY